MSSKPTVIIPARYGSSRFMGKPLALLNGRSLIWHVWQSAKATGYPVYVATDDERIAAECNGFGAAVVMTGSCENGTERCADVAAQLELHGPVINWQGDSPLVPRVWVEALLASLEEDRAQVATPVQACTARQVRELKSEFISNMPGGTFAVVNERFGAIYFSKAPVPLRGPFWLHVGLYAYAPGVLRSYGRSACPLERSEQLEQLRFIERGVHIQCVPVDGDPIWEVNNPSDVRIVERLLRGEHGTLR